MVRNQRGVLSRPVPGACWRSAHRAVTAGRARSLHLFTLRRADIECFARDLEVQGRARATGMHARVMSSRAGRAGHGLPSRPSALLACLRCGRVRCGRALFS